MLIPTRGGNLFRIRSRWYLFFLYLIASYRFFLWRRAKKSASRAYTS